MNSQTHTVKVDIPTLEKVDDVVKIAHWPNQSIPTYAISAELVREIGLLLWKYEGLRISLREALAEEQAA